MALTNTAKVATLSDASPHTFTVRMGSTAGTMYINGNSTGVLLDDTCMSSTVLTECAL